MKHFDLTEKQWKRRKKKEEKFGWERLEQDYVLGSLSGERFYKSREWRELRFAALNKYGRKCMSCGVRPSDGAVIQVDHIRPRYTNPELALEMDNLQILCRDCNLGKGVRSKIDLRVIRRKG